MGLPKNRGGVNDYFLAGRDSGWIAVGGSLFSSNIGAEHLVGLAGTGAASGLAVGHFEWLASLILLLLAWFFVPFYFRTGVVTMPEFLEKRFNPACRWYFTMITVVSYVLTKISVGLFAGGLIIQELTGLDLWVSALLIVLFTGVYTLIGGLRAVIYTDLMQTFVMIAGSGVLVLLGLHRVGGWHALQAQAPTGFFSMWKPLHDPNFPWTGIVFGAPLLGIWYWCTDQYIVQRALSAKTIDHAQSGSLLAGYLKILPVFIFILPGVIAAVLYPELTKENSNRALPLLATHLLGPGLKGLFLAGLLAALMSSLSSVFNSCSTLLTWDIYKKFRPEASERKLVWVGRASTVVLVVLGLMWIPLMKNISSQLYVYLQSVQGYIAPPIAACFLFGLLIKRLNGPGAIASLLTGFVLGFFRLLLELKNGSDHLGLAAGSFWKVVAEVNFLHYALFLFVICSAVLFIVSWATNAPLESQLVKVFPSSTGEPKDFSRSHRIQRSLNIGLSILLVVLMIVLWMKFS